MKSITLGSLFDGSGGFPLAGTHAGMTPVWAAEIEPYPIAVSSLHFPQMKHLGDVSQIDGETITPVDIITFGSPCQDMSIAGKREGIKHKDKGDDETTRSGLFYEAIRIIKEMRETTHGKYPKYAVWENVYGAFSSNKGEDFRCVLEEFTRICDEKSSIPRPADGKWRNAGEIVGDNFSIAWRLFDAQYWGVPQRRKRIYLVADFTGRRAGKILFERESMRGNSTESGTPRQETAGDATGGTERSRGIQCLNPWDAQTQRLYNPDGIFAALRANSGGGGQRIGLVLSQNSFNNADYNNKIYALQGNAIDRADTAGCNGCGWREDVCYTLNTIDRPALCFKSGQGSNARSLGINDHTSPSLVADAGGNTAPAVCYDARGNGDGTLCSTLTGDHENRITDYTAVVVKENPKPPRKYIIRRLTPLECCRLQGFPDGWGDLPEKENMTDEEFAFWQAVRDTYARINSKATKSYTPPALLKWYNKLHTDSAEYKMWGNGIALPCAKFIMEGIAELCKED